jgi:bacillopeptidase F
VISHDPLPNQSEVQSPYQVQATITDQSGVAEALLYYSLNNTDYTSIVMGALSNDVFEADIPGQPAGTTINYYIEATDASPASNTGSTAIFHFVILLPGSETQLLSSDFEADNGQLTVTLGSDWQWGNPFSGPPSAHSGTRVWGTNLTGNYSPNANATLDTPPIDLRNVVSPILSLWQWYSFESSGGHFWDGGNVKVSVDGGAFEVLQPVGGYDGALDNPQNPLHGEPRRILASEDV